MPPLEELVSLLSGGSRVIVIAEKDVDLRPGPTANRLCLLKMAEGSTAAGGRGGGFGERKVTGVAFYFRDKGEWTKAYEASDGTVPEKFEVPYYVSRLPMTFPDGTEGMGYGVVDPELIGQMLSKAGIPSPS